jgi:hypothetical protein
VVFQQGIWRQYVLPKRRYLSAKTTECHIPKDSNVNVVATGQIVCSEIVSEKLRKHLLLPLPILLSKLYVALHFEARVT